MNRADMQSASSGRSSSWQPDERLVVLTNIPAPYRTSFFNTLSDVLSSAGIAFHVLYFAESEPNRHWTLDPDANHYPFTILPGLHFTVGNAYIHFNPGVISALRSLNPRWLVVGGAWHLPTVLLSGLPWVSRRAARILWSEGHADAVLNPHGAIAAVRRWAYSRYDAFAVPNLRSGRFALHEAGSERPILPLANTVDEDFFRRPDGIDRGALRQELGLPEDARVVVTVCQLVDRKGVVELARAFASPRTPCVRAHKAILVFLGDGEKRPDIQAIAASSEGDEIRILGHLLASEVRKWLWAADGFVLATRLDPNPLSPIEASFAGLPLLLSSNAGNVDELVIERETGWRFDPHDDDSIEAALDAFFTVDDAMLKQMGAAAQRNATSSFCRRAVAERFVAALLKNFPWDRKPR